VKPYNSYAILYTSISLQTVVVIVIHQCLIIFTIVISLYKQWLLWLTIPHMTHIMSQHSDNENNTTDMIRSVFILDCLLVLSRNDKASTNVVVPLTDINKVTRVSLDDCHCYWSGVSLLLVWFVTTAGVVCHCYWCGVSLLMVWCVTTAGVMWGDCCSIVHSLTNSLANHWSF